MHNPKTDECVGPIVVWASVCIGAADGPGEWKGTDKLVLSAHWRIVKSDRDSFRRVQDTAIYQFTLLTLCRARKACVTFTLRLVCARREAAALLSGLIVPVIDHSRWCTRMRLDKRLVMRPMQTVPHEHVME